MSDVEMLEVKIKQQWEEIEHLRAECKRVVEKYEVTLQHRTAALQMIEERTRGWWAPNTLGEVHRIAKEALGEE